MLTQLIERIRAKQIEYINKVAKSALELYVPSEVVREVWDTEPKEALVIIQEWLSNPVRSCFLLRGDSGAGKTLFMQWLTLHLWKNYKDGQPIPLFIPLLTQINPRQELLDTFLEKSCGIKNDEEISFIKKQPLLLILDGFDEMHEKVNLYESNEFWELPGLKVLTTCRSQWLATIKEYRKLFCAYEASGDSQPELLESYVIHTFTKEQTKNYLQKYVKKRRIVIESETNPLKTLSVGIVASEDWTVWETYQKYIEKIIGLSELLSSPFVLNLLVETLPSILKDCKEEKEVERLQVLRIDLYREFVNGWFKRQRDKLLRARKINHLCSIEEAFRVYSESLAQAMLRVGKTGIVYEVFDTQGIEQGDLRRLLSSVVSDEGDKESVNNQRGFGVFFSEHEITLSDSTKVPLSLIRSGCPLMQAGDNEWSFLHKSLLEYFGAESLFKSAMLRANIALGCELNEKLLIDEPSLEFLIDRVKEDIELKKRLFAVIEESKYEERVEIASANAITILNRARVSFIAQDFRRIKIRGADLSQGLLEGIDLREADLREVDFTGARMNRANLSGALLQNAFFGELPYLEIKSQIFCIDYSEDGKWFAVGELSGYINLYNAKTYKRERRLRNWDFIFEGYQPVNNLCFTPDSKILAVSSVNRTIRLWEVSTGRRIKTLEGHTSHVTSLVFGRDGTILASGNSDSTIRLWEVSTGHCIKILEGHTSGVNSVVISQDGATLASGSSDNSIRLWEMSTGRVIEILTGHSHSVDSLAFSRGGRMLASGSADNTIRLWEVTTGRCMQTLKRHTGFVTCVAFSSDDSTLASGSGSFGDNSICLWEVSTGRCIQTLVGHTDSVVGVVFSRDSAILASGSEDGRVHLWLLTIPRRIEALEDHMKNVTDVAFSPNGVILASGSWGEDKTIRLWEVITGRIIKILEGHTSHVNKVVFSQDGAVLASESLDGSIGLWEVCTGRCIEMLPLSREVSHKVAFSRDGTMLASTGFGETTIDLWEVSNGRYIKTLKGSERSVCSIVFNQNGAIIASGSEDNTIRLWEVVTGQCIKTLEGHTHWAVSFAFSQDGTILASGSGDIRLWKVSTGKLIKTLKEHTTTVNGLAFTLDSQYLISADRDKTVRVWQNPSWLCIKTLYLNASINSLSLSESIPQFLVIAVTHEFWIYELVIENKMLDVVFKNCWGYRSTLICQEANVGGAVGLSENQFALFSQRKALGKPSEKTTEKVLAGLHELTLYNPKIPIKNFEENNRVTLTEFFVTVVRKKNTEHALLIIETIEDNHYIIRQAEFFLDRNKTSFNVLLSAGEGLVEVAPKTVVELKTFKEKDVGDFKTFSISPEQAKALIENITSDRSKKINYLNVVSSSITSSSSESSEANTHNCFTWARENLNKIGVNTECLESWKDIFVVKPSNVLKKK